MYLKPYFLFLQGVKLLVEDLTVRGQQVYFWRWQESAMFTVLGYDSTLSRHFRFDTSMQNIFRGKNVCFITL